MYGDYSGKVTVDTVDHFTTMEEFARHFEIDTDVFEVLRIEIGGSRELLSSNFVCKNRENDEIKKFAIEPYNLVFERFFKRSEIVIENKKTGF